jgi:hypothetical protein
MSQIRARARLSVGQRNLLGCCACRFPCVLAVRARARLQMEPRIVLGRGGRWFHCVLAVFNRARLRFQRGTVRTARGRARVNVQRRHGSVCAVLSQSVGSSCRRRRRRRPLIECFFLVSQKGLQKNEIRCFGEFDRLFGKTFADREFFLPFSQSELVRRRLGCDHHLLSPCSDEPPSRLLARGRAAAAPSAAAAVVSRRRCIRRRRIHRRRTEKGLQVQISMRPC